jgi:hypothetical protein
LSRVERETLALEVEIAKASPRPLVIDEDALQPEIETPSAVPDPRTGVAGFLGFCGFSAGFTRD